MVEHVNSQFVSYPSFFTPTDYGFSSQSAFHGGKHSIEFVQGVQFAFEFEEGLEFAPSEVQPSIMFEIVENGLLLDQSHAIEPIWGSRRK